MAKYVYKYLLEACMGDVLGVDFSLKLTNPYFIKQLPNCRSDVKDVYWICSVFTEGLENG
jgi:hypothetical protein